MSLADDEKGLILLKKKRKWFAGIMVIMVSLLLLPPTMVIAGSNETGDVSKIPVERIYGTDAYDTAMAVADKIAETLNNNGQFDAIVVASGNVWQDAIAGTPLAIYKKAPIILVDKTVVSSQKDLDYINKHLAKDKPVYILGGSAVVPEEIVISLKDMGYNNIERISGMTAGDTSLAIAKKLPKSQILETVFVSDQDVGSALSMMCRTFSLDKTEIDVLDRAGIIKKADIVFSPFILVSDNKVTPDQKEFADSVKVTTAIGDIAKSISDLYTQEGTNHLGSLNKIRGKNRYDLNSYYNTTFANNKNHYLVNGEQFMDALTGTVLAGLRNEGNYVILTTPDKLQPETEDIFWNLAYFAHNEQFKPDPNTQIWPRLTIFGGANAVSNDAVVKVQEILNGQGDVTDIDFIDARINRQTFALIGSDNDRKTIKSKYWLTNNNIVASGNASDVQNINLSSINWTIGLYCQDTQLDPSFNKIFTGVDFSKAGVFVRTSKTGKGNMLLIIGKDQNDLLELLKHYPIYWFIELQLEQSVSSL